MSVAEECVPDCPLALDVDASGSFHRERRTVPWMALRWDQTTAEWMAIRYDQTTAEWMAIRWDQTTAEQRAYRWERKMAMRSESGSDRTMADWRAYRWEQKMGMRSANGSDQTTGPWSATRLHCTSHLRWRSMERRRTGARFLPSVPGEHTLLPSWDGATLNPERSSWLFAP